MTKWSALAGMIAGTVTVIVWESFESLSAVYEIIPGFIAGAAAIILVSLVSPKPSDDIIDEYNEAVRQTKE